MSATKLPGRSPHRRRSAAGVFAVEFAIVVVVFFTVIFGVMELARLMYVFNTLQEVTRRAARAAANTDFTNASGMDAVRQAAIFRSSAGELALGSPIRDSYVRIDYMALVLGVSGLTLTPIASTALPASPAQNRLNCVSNPNGGSCISFVRVRICDPGDTSTCNPAGYVPIFPFINLVPTLPSSTTILRAETLGYRPGNAL